MDFEGRNIRVDFDTVSVMSMYLPSGSNAARLDHKLEYMDLLQTYINDLKKEIPNLVIGGDYNICHEAIDIHDPVRNKNVSGFLPVDLNKEPDQYTWWSYRANARANNKGWRIDYNMVSKPLEQNISRAIILKDAMHSDHCPHMVELKF